MNQDCFQVISSSKMSRKFRFMTVLWIFLIKVVCFPWKYLKSYNFGKRTYSKKWKTVSDSVKRNLHKKKMNPVKRTVWCLTVLSLDELICKTIITRLLTFGTKFCRNIFKLQKFKVFLKVGLNQLNTEFFSNYLFGVGRINWFEE